MGVITYLYAGIKLIHVSKHFDKSLPILSYPILSYFILSYLILKKSKDVAWFMWWFVAYLTVSNIEVVVHLTH